MVHWYMVFGATHPFCKGLVAQKKAEKAGRERGPHRQWGEHSRPGDPSSDAGGGGDKMMYGEQK